MAAGRDMRARLLLVLGDGISRGLGGIQQRLQGIAGAVRGIGLAGVALGALTFAGPVRQAALFETGLRDIEITAGRTGRAVEDAMRSSREELYRLANATRTASTDLLEAKAILTSRGLEPTQIAAFTPIIADVAGAAGAAARDVANLNVALNRNAHLADDQVRLANAVILRAGQLGGFELKDSARYLGPLIAQAATMRVAGMEAVHMLAAGSQVMLEGFAGDAAQTAAGAQQLLSHLMSHHTLEEAKKFGEDFRGTFNLAVSRGDNPIEAVMSRVRAIIRADPLRATTLLPDQNTRQAALAWIDGWERYKQLRDQLRDTDANVIDQALIERTRGLGAELRHTNEMLAQFGNRIGDAAGTGLPALNAGLAELLRLTALLDERYPGLLDGTVKWVAGLAILATVLGAIAPVLGFLARGLGLLHRPLGWLLRTATLLVWPLRILMAALVATGVGATTAAAFVAILATTLAVSAYHIITHWAEVRAFMLRLWNDPMAEFQRFIEWVDGWTGGALTGAVVHIKAAWQLLGAFFNTLFGGIEARFNEFVAFVRRLLDPIMEVYREIDRRISAGVTATARPGAVRAHRGHEDAPRAADPGLPSLNRTKVEGRVVVELSEGLRARTVESFTPGLALSAAGIRSSAMLGRD